MREKRDWLITEIVPTWVYPNKHPFEFGSVHPFRGLGPEFTYHT